MDVNYLIAPENVRFELLIEEYFLCDAGLLPDHKSRQYFRPATRVVNGKRIIRLNGKEVNEFRHIDTQWSQKNNK